MGLAPRLHYDGLEKGTSKGSLTSLGEEKYGALKMEIKKNWTFGDSSVENSVGVGSLIKQFYFKDNASAIMTTTTKKYSNSITLISPTKEDLENLVISLNLPYDPTRVLF